MERVKTKQTLNGRAEEILTCPSFSVFSLFCFAFWDRKPTYGILLGQAPSFLS